MEGPNAVRWGVDELLLGTSCELIVHGDRGSPDGGPAKLSMDASTFCVWRSATVDSFSVSCR